MARAKHADRAETEDGTKEADIVSVRIAKLLGENTFQFSPVECQNGTLELSPEELVILNILKTEPSVTQKRIAELSGKSERTIKRRTVEMQERGLIIRENGKRNGKWKVLVEI